MTAVAAEREVLLDVAGLSVHYRGEAGAGVVRAVDDASLQVREFETVGLVGESGSGKTTIGRAVLGLAPVAGGEISFAGEQLTRASARKRRLLCADLQVIFQDPYSSLNPARKIGQTLAEPFRAKHRRSPAEGVEHKVGRALEKVGLDPEVADRYPYQFSGGQRQRIAIARALVTDPRLIICDEPVSSLDLSVQAQVLNLLRTLQTELGLSYLFVSHDLAVVRHVSHRIVILYRGRVMEEGPADAVYAAPAHPYTRILLAAAPIPDPAEQRRRRADAAATRNERMHKAVTAVGAGCPFAARCAHATAVCEAEQPDMETLANGVRVACHHWRELRSVEHGGRR
ncbi:oligopeptide/dipeptide ABC transporter ATP-binding protein [Saccharomonospora sp. NPDC046836]|uniref:ABC transporter ATP-binding protein n=1 Tax=Saccharomonospora sp. NPDC046836 TaxID=3156921 RepID=UPI0033DE8BB4